MYVCVCVFVCVCVCVCFVYKLVMALVCNVHGNVISEVNTFVCCPNKANAAGRGRGGSLLALYLNSATIC